MLHINYLALLVGLTSAPWFCYAGTYWLHASCVGNASFTVALDEALTMARRASERLESQTDTLQQSYFKTIFMQSARAGITAPLSSQLSVAGNNAVQGFNMIHTLTPTPVQTTANIRFYCDNDPTGPGQRWTLVPNIPGDPNPNSGRPPATQEWDNLGDAIRVRGLNAGCNAPAAPGATPLYAHTTKGKSIIAPNQNPFRAAVTICNRALTAQYRALTDFPTDVDLSANGNTLIALNTLTSLTILHELTHAVVWERRDFVFPATATTPKRNGYGWTNILLLTPAEAVLNAESYAFFGLLARLGDRGFRLFNTNAGTAAGKLTYNRPEITSKIKRMVKFWEA